MLIATLRQYLPSAFLLALVLVYSAAHASSEDIVDVATSDAPVDTIKNKAEDLALTTANQKINIFEGIALDNGWTHLDLNLGWESGKPTLGIMSVYGLRETNNWFIFNQSSLVNYDERNTVNLGFGARHINDTDTLILGANAFYDYELNSGHQRTSLGIEWLTQPIQARANLYRNLTGSILYKGTYEEVLDGHDFKLAYRLPTTQISHLYYKTTNWSDSQAYRSSTGELGITSQITENVKMSLSAQKIDKESVSGLVSFTYSIPLGEPEADSGNNKSVRHMLYKPVQRENRIKKKSVKLGVTASGY
tara:strand:- start:1170 stop:2087 length:918 start_codon:yes stop_codon:yes gene_type:complete